MLGQTPFGFQNMPNMNSYNPFENYDYKINELEKRISMLEQKIKELSNENYKNNSFDYQTSMHMM